MSKIEQNKEKKRQAILKAAKQNFLADGYTLANMDKIASEAKMTKQTVYRYFSSKADLFKATLAQMGSHYDDKSVINLAHADTKTALLGFAIDYIHFHLSEEHIATFRLLVSESNKVPELSESFISVGPNDTEALLSQFFGERFELKETEVSINLWLAMLLSPRGSVLMGMPIPNVDEIEKHAADSTNFLMSALANVVKLEA